MVALFQGIQLGILIFFLVGPIFILILEETIKNGKKAALMLAAGLWISDGSFALLAHFGLHTFLVDQDIDYRWGFIAAFILIIVGISSIKNKKSINTENKIRFVRSGNLFLKGFLINTFNPFVLLFWLGVATQVDYETESSTQLFYIGLFFTVVSGDLLKIVFANKISQKLKPSHLANIRAIGGILLIIFGLVMIYRISQM